MAWLALSEPGVLGDGRVLKIGTIDELLEFDHPWVQAYFKGPRGRAAHHQLDEQGQE